MTHTESASQLVALGIQLQATEGGNTYIISQTGKGDFLVATVDTEGILQCGLLYAAADDAVKRWFELAFPLRHAELMPGILAAISAPSERKPGRRPLNNSYLDGRE